MNENNGTPSSFNNNVQPRISWGIIILYCISIATVTLPTPLPLTILHATLSLCGGIYILSIGWHLFTATKRTEQPIPWYNHPQFTLSLIFFLIGLASAITNLLFIFPTTPLLLSCIIIVLSLIASLIVTLFLISFFLPPKKTPSSLRYTLHQYIKNRKQHYSNPPFPRLIYQARMEGPDVSRPDEQRPFPTQSSASPYPKSESPKTIHKSSDDPHPPI